MSYKYHQVAAGFSIMKKLQIECDKSNHYSNLFYVPLLNLLVRRPSSSVFVTLYSIIFPSAIGAGQEKLDYVQYNRSSLVPFLTQIKTNEQAKNQYLTKWS